MLVILIVQPAAYDTLRRGIGQRSLNRFPCQRIISLRHDIERCFPMPTITHRNLTRHDIGQCVYEYRRTWEIVFRISNRLQIFPVCIDR